MDNLLEQANALAERKDFAGAIAIVEKLVAHRAALSPGPPGCDWNLHQKLAKWYVKVGRFDEALELLHQSRANLESKATTIEELQREMVELRASPTWRPGSKVKMPAQGMLEQLALVCHDLGSVLYQADRLDESIESYQRSLSIWKVTHATITGFISTGLLNLSSVHGLRGEWNLAGELIEEGLELERSLQPDGSFVARLSGNLAVVRQKQGRLAEAAQLKATAAEMHLKNEGPGQSLAPFELNDAGQMFLALKDWSRAKSCFQRSLALLREADSLPKQPIVGLLLNLSNVEIQQRYFVASLPYLREALPICESEPCNLARECGATLRRLTESLVTTDHFDEAETVGLRWLAYLDKNTSGDEPELPAALANLAMTYHGLKQDEQALCLIERAIPLVERHAVPNDPGVANYFHIQADILNSLHRFAAAKSAEARARQIESRGASNS